MWLFRQKQQLLGPLMLQAPHLRLLPSPSLFPLLLLTSPLRLLSSATAVTVRRNPPPPPPGTHFLVDYLVRSCGLSRDEAAKASRPLAHLKSPDKPDAVLRLLKREGLCAAQIRRIVLGHPRVLVSNPRKTLEPKIMALREAGFSGSELAQLISACPLVLLLRNALARIEFWRDLLGSTQNFLKASSKLPMIVGLRLEPKVVPQLALLSSVGIPGDKIGMVVLRNPRLVGASLDRIKGIAEHLKSMGFTPGSGLFVQAFGIFVSSSRSKVDARFKLLRSFGWSQEDTICAFRSYPNVVNVSDKKIRAVMNFLLREAGCDPLYVARRPVLLGFSLEKRLMPRHYVLQFLRTKGLRGANRDLWTAMCCDGKKFVKRYIAPKSEKFPKIIEIYHTDGAKTISN